MKILNAAQIKAIDKYTIISEPISSIDLMERASIAFVRKFKKIYSNGSVSIICGVGNNGGDGLAVARLLNKNKFDVKVFAIGSLEKATNDFKANYEKLDHVDWIISKETFPNFSKEEIIIDALFGSGITRSLDGLYADLVKWINISGASIVSIDIASGLFADLPKKPKDNVIRPDYTISFQVPKLAFFQPGLSEFVGKWFVVDIGLDAKKIHQIETDYFFTGKVQIGGILSKRKKFAHKGDFGRLQLIIGSKGKLGAAVLAGKAAMKAGAGLLFIQVPGCGSDVIHLGIPEAMVIADESENLISKIDLKENAEVFGIGPGIGTDAQTKKALIDFFDNIDNKTRLVLDADAINIISENKSILDKLPHDTILTPHPGEFKRLVGEWKNDYEKIEKLQKLCREYKINVVLKGAHSAVCDSFGKIHFNSSGNPGMATAGSGDVLLGIIAGLLTQGIKPFSALLLGVYIHGLAGDHAKKQKGIISLTASDIIDNIPQAIKKITN